MTETQNKPIIAAFDFDGTITLKDTLFDFISFYFSKRKLLSGLIILSPILIGYKMGIIKNYRAKQIMFSYFFKNRTIIEFNDKSEKYAKRINKITRQSTLQKINEHQSRNHKVIIISASISNWIIPWANSMGIHTVMGTEIEINDGLLTGKFSSKNCYGPEKVNRLLELYPDRAEYDLYAYGDSEGDKELLALSDYPTLLK